MKSTISSNGQTTVPAELVEGGVLLRTGTRGAHGVDSLFGRLTLEKPVDELLDEMRGPRPQPRVGRRTTGRKA